MKQRSRSRVALRAALLALAVSLPVSADAPVSGPDRQYAPFDAGKKTITDNWTHLVWERPLVTATTPYPDAMTFAEAQAHCDALTLTGSAGAMRLPSVKELLTIVDEDPHAEYDVDHNVTRYIDRLAFSHTPAEQFWTSSKIDLTQAYTVDFATGKTEKGALTDKKRVRCVDYP